MRAGRRALPALLLAGCTGHEITASPRGAGRFLPWSDATPEYRIAAGDRLRVQYLLTPELNEVALVAPDGQVALRAAGRVEVAGRSVTEAERAVALASRRFLTEPLVTLGIEEAAGSVVLVGGQVRNPGQHPLPARRGALEAVIRAGGFTDEARLGEVVLIRRGPGELPMLRTLDLRGFVSGTGAEDVPLAAGDIVFVPRSRIAEVNLWIDQYVNRLVPFSRSFSYSVNRLPTAGAAF
ncbi:polysaccharide biosynthesis/export family protein [Roseococcus sp. DSY-14]|uniref:polysaccharide biosynthesis/export family protein n=1 Tax=Roseococcus sp. DSY-14 TaxID=3369650 RepID=UPI00387B5784